MANRDILAVGTSAGGVEALLFLVKRLPRDFPGLGPGNDSPAPPGTLVT